MLSEKAIVIARHTEITLSGRDRDEARDCTVRALASAFAIPYAEAHRIMALNGRKPKQGANIRRAMESPLVRRLGDIHFRPQEPRRTLYKLIGELQEGRYVLAMAGHAFAVVDGKIHDKIVLPPGVRVKAIWKVTPAKVEDSVTNIPAPVLS